MHHFLGVPWLSTSTRIFTWIYWEGGFQSAVLSYIVNKFTRFSSFFRHWFAHSILLYVGLVFLSLSMICSFIVTCFIIWINHTFSGNWFFFLICKKITQVKALHKLKEKKWFFSVKTFTTSTCMYYISTLIEHDLDKTIFYTVLRRKGILFNCKNIASFIAVHHLL